MIKLTARVKRHQRGCTESQTRGIAPNPGVHTGAGATSKALFQTTGCNFITQAGRRKLAPQHDLGAKPETKPNWLNVTRRRRQRRNAEGKLLCKLLWTPSLRSSVSCSQRATAKLPAIGFHTYREKYECRTAADCDHRYGVQTSNPEKTELQEEVCHELMENQEITSAHRVCEI